MPLSQPPHDHDGVEIHDHEGILPDDGVIRRISEHQVTIDKRDGRKRISSIAFKASSGPRGGMSVDLEREIVEAGLEAREYVNTPRWMGSVRFKAEDVRNLGFKIGYHPLPDNPYHGEVWGDFKPKQIKALRSICEWFVEIEGVSFD